ncbi:MAG: ABC transporter ATP-binding protein [Candidatus Dormibacteraeota bacterium]|nr:ABC transporter ATP-binding protein [Candidatus Dormibacteraeota bacterium]
MLELVHVSKQYEGGQNAVQDLSLTIETGETCMLVGPSGCGKTTTLRMINRMVEPTSGQILHDGNDVMGMDPVKLRLSMGYVIQQTGLFPHLTIADNVGTVPRLLGWDRRRIAGRVNELMELVGLDPGVYARRYPAQLSGGQQQRVGVARALAADPPVLLMDEPFGAIDRVTRESLQDEFLRIQREVQKTIAFVTHDIDEAVKMGDRIALMRQGGVLEQYDAPARILAQPATEFVAQFLGPDRAQKRLAVLPVALAELDTDDGAVGMPEVKSTATLGDALSVMLLNDTNRVRVRSDGRPPGVLTVRRLLETAETNLDTVGTAKS